jgi:hypothetical protein
VVTFATPPLLRNVRPWGDAPVDLTLEDGRITGIRPADAGVDAGVDGRGLLALPGFVNAHAHIDKSWWGLPWQSYGGEGGTEGHIRHERARRDEIGMPSAQITRNVLEQFVAHGTTAVRTHVDVDLGLGLRGIEAVREAAADYDGALTMQIVAFPQDGVLRRPGVLELLGDAARAGVEHIGGLDPATIDRDPVGQIDAILSWSSRAGASSSADTPGDRRPSSPRVRRVSLSARAPLQQTPHVLLDRLVARAGAAGELDIAARGARGDDRRRTLRFGPRAHGLLEGGAAQRLPRVRLVEHARGARSRGCGERAGKLSGRPRDAIGGEGDILQVGRDADGRGRRDAYLAVATHDRHPLQQHDAGGKRSQGRPQQHR